MKTLVTWADVLKIGSEGGGNVEGGFKGKEKVLVCG